MTLTNEEKVEKLKTARDEIVEVYESEATDELIDNGNLSTLNTSILGINNSIDIIDKRA